MSRRMVIFDFVKAVLRRFKPRRSTNGDFKRRRRFRISIQNLSSLATVAELRGRLPGLIALGLLCFIAIGAIWLAIFIWTPLRSLAPMRMQSELREDYVVMAQRLDSLRRVQEQTSAYLLNVRTVLGDTLLQSKAEQEAVALSPLPVDSIMEASSAERAWVQRFEDRERYNLSVLAPIAGAGMHFYAPVSGAIANARVADNGIPYVVVEGTRGMGVSSIYGGSVIEAAYDTSIGGLRIAIQHPNDFVSIYSGLGEVYVGRGARLQAGERIGSAKDGLPLTLELWHNGSPLPLLDYVAL